LFLEPAAVMPVTTEIGSILRDHDQMEGARRDGVVTSGADVLLACLVGLDRGDGYLGKTAHTMTAMVARMPRTTRTTSSAVFSWLRKGLNPTTRR